MGHGVFGCLVEEQGCRIPFPSSQFCSVFHLEAAPGLYGQCLNEISYLQVNALELAPLFSALMESAVVLVQNTEVHSGTLEHTCAHLGTLGHAHAVIRAPWHREVKRPSLLFWTSITLPQSTYLATTPGTHSYVPVSY